ncbi:protein POLAR-like 1 [Oryza brachyantha]|uniref:protein POLAR-like 1 n=1 Tax=Oryza brachyantha TaxID=4533 RepID=UPI001ADCD544|nr:protein POLAR-like 1 [Oryza brachyantha]
MEGSTRGGGGGGGRAGTEALPLPPPPRLAAVSSPSPAASIRAHLARAAGAGGGLESCQSPRSLLSRLLQRGDGGSGGKFGCRVRLPRRYSSTSAAGGGRDDAKDSASEQDVPARVKVVGRAPELSLETPRSSCTLDEGRNGKKKPEEEIMSMNLGLGASLVLLLSKGAVELNKMVELRVQMEALVSEIRKETQSKKQDSASAAAAAAVAAGSSSQESDGRSITAVKDPIARAAVSDDAMSNCSGGGGGGGRAAVVMHRMEAELQVELNRLQCAAGHGENRAAPMHGLELPLLQVKTTKSNVSDSPPRSCVADEDEDDDVAEGGNAGEAVEEDDEEEEEYDEEEEEEYDAGGGGDKSPPHGGVSARALERRLYELLQKRQQERIVELEAALDSTQRRLHEKEREVVWWRDAAKLVTHRRDESSRRFARS